MAHLIIASAIDRYQAAPSPSTVAAVKSLHTNIRDTLGSSYETFLQGSYKNDTSISDLNDVDIVAIRKNTTSSVFSSRTATHTISWETIFQEVKQRLEASHHYRGKVATGDKCIKVATGLNADVVPAVEITAAESDPISIYSRRTGEERQNFPRVHYDNGVAKHTATQQRFKPTVRMFKVWARNHFPDGDPLVPSFYLECLIYNFVDAAFLTDSAERFVNIASTIVALDYSTQKVFSVAGDKDILVESEWSRDHFQEFQLHLTSSLRDARAAIGARSASDALRLWRRTFNE